MRLFKKFAEGTLFLFLFFSFALAGISVAAPQEGEEDAPIYYVTQVPSEPFLSTDSLAFFESLLRTLTALENGFYYKLSPEAKAKMFTRIREALNEELAKIDGHTALIPPSSAKEFTEESRGIFFGIGMSIMVHPDDNKTAVENLAAFVKKVREKYHGNAKADGPASLQLSSLTAEENQEYLILEKSATTIGAHGIVIKEVFPGSPAEKAGIKAGSTIHSVDGVTIVGMSLSDATELIKGEKGTAVTLSVTTGNAGVSSEIVAIRGKVIVPMIQSASYKAIGNGVIHTVGYVRIKQFSGMVAEQFSEEAAKLMKDGATKLIIDVRGNPGGYLSIVHDILALLMPPGLVMFYTETQNGPAEGTPFSIGDINDIHRIFTGDIAVLTDGNSASGSEILAGALRDHGLATLIGVKTFGKGSMQSVYHLPDDSILKFTIALYRIPSGKLVEKVGIEPDIRAEDDPKTPEDEVIQTALNFLAHR